MSNVMLSFRYFKMHSLWGWISSICRKKRILLLLCTFGSSFIVFNYSLLSTTTTNLSSNPFSNNNKIDDVDSFTGGDLQKLEKHEELARIEKKSPTLPFQVPVPSLASSSLSSTFALSRNRITSNIVAKDDTLISSSSHAEQSVFMKSNSKITQPPEPPPISKHAQKSFTLQHRKATNNQAVMLSDHSSPTTNINSIRSRVNFQSAIEQKDDNNNSSISSNLQESNNRISTSSNSFHSSKSIHNHRASKSIDNNNNNDNVKTDEKRQPSVASSSKTKSEIMEASITISSSKNESISGAVTATPPADFPMLPNSIQSSLFQLSPGLFSPVTTRPPLESLSAEPYQLTPFHTSHFGSNNNNNSNNHPFSSPLPITTTTTTTSPSKSNLLSPFDIPPCNTTFQLRRIQKRKKNLTVIENFIMGWQHFKCNETITYTTHGDYRYLDNLVPLVDRWKGPVSVAVYCPGEDLEESLKLISYLKLCTSSNINKWATFHLIYDTKFVKRPVKDFTKHGDIPWLDFLYQEGKWKDCSQKPIFSKGNYTFRIRNGLLYPINIARNIARAAATTYFVLASDIELYPSINLIPSFMEMLGRLKKEEEETNNYTKKNNNKFTAAAAAVMAKFLFSGSSSSSSSSPTVSDAGGENEIGEKGQNSEHQEMQQQQQQHRLSGNLHPQQQRGRHVFVLPVFEVKKDIVPCQVETKEQLASLLKHRAAILFHHSICPQCHTFPRYEEWKKLYSGGDGDDGAIQDYTKYNCSGNDNNQSSNSSVAFMRIFHKAKRKHPYQLWEPIFIGTKVEPIYDERLSWEGLRDKMVSGYVMCALDYDFYILDNAFLVHKPGIRKVNHLVTKTVMSQDRLINYRIRSELLKKFGKHDECAL